MDPPRPTRHAPLEEPVGRDPTPSDLMGRRWPGFIERPLQQFRHVAISQFDLLGNVVSLLGTTLATSILGLGFWWAAARLLSPTSIGYGSAALSAVTLLATIGMLGFGTLLLGDLASGRGDGRLVATGITISGATSLVLALAFALGARFLTPHFAPYTRRPIDVLLFAAAVAMTSIGLVLDTAMVGLFLAKLQLWRNIVFGIVKLLAVVAIGAGSTDPTGAGQVLAWAIGSGVSLLLLAQWLQRRGRSPYRRPGLGDFRGLARSALVHHWLNLAAFAPRLAMPLVVTAVLSAEQNGAFYPGWMIATTVYMAPSHFSTSLFAVGSHDQTRLREKARFSLKAASLAGLPPTIALAILAKPTLELFGPSYAAHGTRVLQFLLLAYLPNVARFHYIALRRAQGLLRQAALSITVLGVAEVAAAAAGGLVDGLSGLGLAFAATVWVEAVILARPIARAVSPREQLETPG